MRKSDLARKLVLFMAVGAMSVSGCKKEMPTPTYETPSGNTRIEVPNPYAHSKIHYQNGAVVWDTNDQVSIARGNGAFATFTIDNNTVDEDPVCFYGDLGDLREGEEDYNYYGVCPRMSGVTVLNGVITLPQAIPTTQTLKQGGFASESNVMVGMSENTTMYFKNLCGLLKISLRGTDVRLQKIRIQSTDSTILSGMGSVDMYGTSPEIEWTEGFGKTYIEACAPYGGMDLTAGKTFYIVVPECNMGNRYTITLTDMLGNAISLDRSIGNISVARASVTNLGTYTATVERDPEKVYFTTTNGTVDNQLLRILTDLGEGCEINGANGVYSASYSQPIETLYHQAFQTCNTLKSIILPNTIKEFEGDYHFGSCAELQTVTLPDNSNFKTISFSCFQWCEKLTTVIIPSSVTTIKACAFQFCRQLASIDLPENLQTIGQSAFSGAGLTSITIPEGVTTIPMWTFFGCPNLRNVYLPASFTEIGDEAFRETPISHIDLPDGLTTIGEGSMVYCENLTSIDIPASVSSIGEVAFYYCRSLSSVTVRRATPVEITENMHVFVDISEDAVLYVPIGSIDAYRSAGWDRYFGGGIQGIQ